MAPPRRRQPPSTEQNSQPAQSPQSSQGRVRATPSAPIQDDGPAWAESGDAAFSRATQEKTVSDQRRAAGGSANFAANYRFRIRPGEEAEIVVLDADVGHAHFEHHVPGPGKNWAKSVFEPCPKETENCPICARAESEDDGRFRPSYYVILLTVLDLSGYTIKSGKRAGETVSHTKRIMPIKPQATPTWERLRQAALDSRGSMRGMYLVMKRDNVNQVNIGEPMIMNGGSLFDFYEESDLVETFGHPAKVDGGKVVKPENDDITPFDYGAIFARPSAEDLRQRYGFAAQPGSNADNNDTWTQQEGEASGRTDGGNSSGNPPPARSRVRSRVAAQPETDDNDPPF